MVQFRFKLEEKKGSWHPKYGIHYATSNNGIDWKSHSKLIIPFKNKYEHSFGRPTVLYKRKKFHMWFACRGNKNFSTYRIGYAYSNDGIRWVRNDKLSGINISKRSSDWDGESICYPYVFTHLNIFYVV